jgi:hypothetical protein
MRALECVDLDSLSIHEVIPLFSYQKKSDYQKKILKAKRCKFFKKKIILDGKDELENFLFETIENKEEYLTGPQEMHLSNLTNPETLIRLREINLIDLKVLSLTNCSLSKDLFKKVLLESEYIPRLTTLSLKDLTIDKWCFSMVCQLELESLDLDNIHLLNSKLNLFPFLCLESHFFSKLKRLTIRNNVATKDLDILKEDFLVKWIQLANGQPPSSVNLNKLQSLLYSKSNPHSPGSTSKSQKENKTSSTKKANSKTSKKSSSKKSSSRKSDRNQEKTLTDSLTLWTQRLDNFGQNLRHLNLNDNPIYDEGLEVILQKLKTKHLETLELKNTNITSQSRDMHWTQ